MLRDPDSANDGVNCSHYGLQQNLPTNCEPGMVFMQDNASTHTAHIVQDWSRDWAEENGLYLIDCYGLDPMKGTGTAGAGEGYGRGDSCPMRRPTSEAPQPRYQRTPDRAIDSCYFSSSSSALDRQF